MAVQSLNPLVKLWNEYSRHSSVDALRYPFEGQLPRVERCWWKSSILSFLAAYCLIGATVYFKCKLCPVIITYTKTMYPIWRVPFPAVTICPMTKGFLYPALHNVVSHWAPPDEKGKFISALMGGTFGTVITWPLVGVLIETLGWSFAFYIPAVITAIVGAFWLIIVSDTPVKHPRIKKEEQDYIEKSLGDTISKQKLLPPVAKVMTSIPFLALLVLHFGNLWGLYFLLTAAPKFMSEVLGFKLAKAGFLAALPYLARALAAFGFGSIGDYLRKKSFLTVTTIRKSFCLFSHIIPGLFLVVLIYVGFDPFVCVAIITLSLGFNGASTMTNLQNSQDLAPNFAGTLYGVINFVGTTSGFISPMLVAHFTAVHSTMHEWQYVFAIGAAAYIIPALVFVLFGSGVVQEWNEPQQQEPKTTTKQVQETY